MEFTFKLLDTEIDYIGSLLMKQPYFEVSQLLEKLLKQVREQNTLTQENKPLE